MTLFGLAGSDGGDVKPPRSQLGTGSDDAADACNLGPSPAVYACRGTVPNTRTLSCGRSTASLAGSSAVRLGATFTLQVAGGHAAVDQERGAGDELGIVTGIEDGSGRDVASLADPANRRH